MLYSLYLKQFYVMRTSFHISMQNIFFTILNIVNLIFLGVSSDTLIQQTTTPSEHTTSIDNNAVHYPVVSVVDGDTIKVIMNKKTEKIRIIGLNTPETVDPRKPVECFGKEASAKAKELLLGKNILLMSDPTQTDRDTFGRLLRYVILPDGTDFGLSMIASGYGYEYTYRYPYEKQSAYRDAQKNAEARDSGLWHEQACTKKTP